jgi:secondary thiamine-phosphate synthase enzyme
MPMLKTISVSTKRRSELVDISGEVSRVVRESGIADGVVTIFVPHTTAGVTINENADPDVTRDIVSKLDREFPQDDDYRHAEGNSDAHIKTSLVGPSIQIIINEGRLVLGTWQGIYFCEFDGPRSRNAI